MGSHPTANIDTHTQTDRPARQLPQLPERPEISRMVKPVLAVDYSSTAQCILSKRIEVTEEREREYSEKGLSNPGQFKTK